MHKQYNEYLLEEYQSRKTIGLIRLTTLCGDMDYDGHWKEALEQIKGDAVAPRVRQLVQDIQLHCIVMQFRG